MITSPVKSVELIDMPLGIWTQVGPRKHVLDGVQIPPWEGAVLRGKRESPLWSVATICRVLCKNGIWIPLSPRSMCYMWVHVGASWRTWLNCPFAAVMLVGWLEFNVCFQHKYGYIRDERQWFNHVIADKRMLLCVDIQVWWSGRATPTVLYFSRQCTCWWVSLWILSERQIQAGQVSDRCYGSVLHKLCCWSVKLGRT